MDFAREILSNGGRGLEFVAAPFSIPSKYGMKQTSCAKCTYREKSAAKTPGCLHESTQHTTKRISCRQERQRREKQNAIAQVKKYRRTWTFASAPHQHHQACSTGQPCGGFRGYVYRLESGTDRTTRTWEVLADVAVILAPPPPPSIRYPGDDPTGGTSGSFLENDLRSTRQNTREKRAHSKSLRFHAEDTAVF